MDVLVHAGAEDRLVEVAHHLVRVRVGRRVEELDDGDAAVDAVADEAVRERQQIGHDRRSYRASEGASSPTASAIDCGRGAPALASPPCRALACLAFASLVLTGCPSGPDLCATVACTESGTVCSPVDGLCHCGSSAGEICEAGYACDAATSSCEIPDACRAPSRWTAGTTAFEERTDPAGLTGVLGVRLSAIDYDGDGWTDLFVRNPWGWTTSPRGAPASPG